MLFYFSQRGLSSLPILDLSINNIKIEQVNSFNFLGITIDSNLLWKEHVKKVRIKLSRSIGVIRRLQKTLACTTLKVLYNSLILPHLQYGLLLWGNHAKELTTLQKRAIRVVMKAKYLSHSEPLFKELSILNLNDMYKLSSLKFYFKYQKEDLPLYFVDMFKPTVVTHSHATRNKNTVNLPRPKHKLLETSIRFNIPLLLSSLPSLVTDKLNTHSLNGFSNYTKKFLLDVYISVCTTVNCFICAKI